MRAVSEKLRGGPALSLSPQIQAQNRRLAPVRRVPQALLLRLRPAAAQKVPQRRAQSRVRPVRQGLPARAHARQPPAERALDARGAREGPPFCLHLLRQGIF